MNKSKPKLASVLEFRSKPVQGPFGPARIEDTMPDDYWISLQVNNFLTTYIILPDSVPVSQITKLKTQARQTMITDLLCGMHREHSVIHGIISKYGSERFMFVLQELFSLSSTTNTNKNAVIRD